ncbi:MMPL family transporter [Demequina sp.]|uniref:MMPL family transporter n=1 Tax=Demequina sp. TaxID=2050685 RepID=UPI003D126362
MAHFLFRIGRGSAARPFIAIIAWAVALLAAAGAFLAFGGKLADTFSIPGTETQRVTEEMSSKIAGLDGGSARIVFTTEDGAAFTAEQQQAISTALASATEIEHVTGVVDPFATQAQRDAQMQELADSKTQIEQGREQVAQGQEQLDAAIAQATEAGMYDAMADDFAAQQKQLDDSTAQLDAGEQQLALGEQLAANAAGLTTVSESGAAALGVVQFDTEVHGVPQGDKDTVVETVEAQVPDGVNAYFSAEFVSGPEGILGVGEIVGVLLALVVLIVMMRALLPALLPIVTSAVGVGIGVATALAFSGVVDMQSVTPVLGVMLGLAVGIDYSLFIVNRHRTQLKRGMEVTESVGLANGTAGNAVVFAGSTVLIALLALNITGIPFMGIMGTVAAFCVAVAVLIAITLTPALLGLIGMRALGKNARTSVGAPEHAEPEAKPMRTGRAVLSLIVAVIALGVIAIPAASMRLGLPDGSQEPADSTQYKAYSTIGAEFGEGINGPLLVTAALPAPVTDDEVLAAQVAVSNEIASYDDVVAVVPVAVSDDNSFLAFQVIPKEGASSESTEELVHALRDNATLADGTVLGVAGEASGNIDISEKLADALPLYLVVVVGLSIIILIVVFRSLLLPVIATAGFVLSLFAALGFVTAVFQWGWLGSLFDVHDPGPILSFLPIMLTGILFGLAMDYQLFLASGMREAYVHGLPARNAVVAGLRHGRAVVTAAAIIMISVFGGFVFSHIAMIRPMGFGLAIGVLFDAFVVRMVIIPAVLHLVGDGAWWLPKWLDKLLPNVDVEGSALEREHPFAGAAEEPTPAT